MRRSAGKEGCGRAKIGLYVGIVHFLLSQRVSYICNLFVTTLTTPSPKKLHYGANALTGFGLDIVMMVLCQCNVMQTQVQKIATEGDLRKEFAGLE